MVYSSINLLLDLDFLFKGTFLQVRWACPDLASNYTDLLFLGHSKFEMSFLVWIRDSRCCLDLWLKANGVTGEQKIIAKNFVRFPYRLQFPLMFYTACTCVLGQVHTCTLKYRILQRHMIQASHSFSKEELKVTTPTCKMQGVSNQFLTPSLSPCI